MKASFVSALGLAAVASASYPVSSSSYAASPSNSTSSYAAMTTSTVYATSVYTITSCAATVTDCPAKMGSVTTDIISLYTTVCPVTATETYPASKPTYPVSKESSYSASTIYSTKETKTSPMATYPVSSSTYVVVPPVSTSKPILSTITISTCVPSTYTSVVTVSTPGGGSGSTKTYSGPVGTGTGYPSGPKNTSVPYYPVTGAGNKVTVGGVMVVALAAALL